MKKRQRPAARGKSLKVDIAASVLIIIAPLLNLFVDAGYNPAAPEIWIIAAGIVAAMTALFAVIGARSQVARCLLYTGLLVLFIDFQFDIVRGWSILAALLPLALFNAVWFSRRHVGVIVLTFFAVANFVTLVKPVEAVLRSSLGAPTVRTETKRPAFVHLVLDEFIGIEGIPTDLPGGAETRAALLDFFAAHGFRVYGGAYSRYTHTLDSIPAILNPQADVSAETLYAASRDPNYFVVEDNAFFDRMHDEGYRIRVYQSAYLDFCRSTATPVASCRTYNHHWFDETAVRSLTLGQRLVLIARTYEKLSFFTGKFRALYELVRGRLGPVGAVLPAWPYWDGRIHGLGVYPIFDRLGADIAGDGGGHVYFVHSLLPHFPYIYDAGCAVRLPLFDWSVRPWANASETTRATRYPLYFEQIHCTMARLGALFDSMRAAGTFADATIIVHGDHGSRIVANPTHAENRAAIADRDLVDALSSLMAVRAPGLEPGYDPAMRELSEIFAQAAFGAPAAPLPPGERRVFLRYEDGTLVAHPMPDFTAGTGGGVDLY